MYELSECIRMSCDESCSSVIYVKPIKQGVGGTNCVDGISSDSLFVVMLTFIALHSFVFYLSDEYETQSVHLFEKQTIHIVCIFIHYLKYGTLPLNLRSDMVLTGPTVR